MVPKHQPLFTITLSSSLPSFSNYLLTLGSRYGARCHACSDEQDRLLSCWTLFSDGRARFKTTIWVCRCSVARAIFNLSATMFCPLQFKALFQGLLFDPAILLIYSRVYSYLCVKQHLHTIICYSNVYNSECLEIQYSSPPQLSVVLLSKVSVTHSQTVSKKIKWKFPEINNS